MESMHTTRSNFTRASFDVNQTIHWEMLSDDQCEEIFMTVSGVVGTHRCGGPQRRGQRGI